MDIKELSFIASRDGKTLPKPVGEQLPRCFWNVKSTGNYSVDCTIGQRLALEYLRYEEADVGGSGILNMIVDDMPRPLTGIEHAFLQMVCFQARAGRGRAKQIATYWDQCAERAA